jgi:hypothetical protein
VPASDWLAPEVIACLEAECGSVAEAVLVALKTPGVGDELAARGVVNVSGFGAAQVYIPPQHERRVYRSVAEHHGCVTTAEPQAARPKSTTAHPGGAPLKEWPRLALTEATRMWVIGAHDHSRTEIAKQVTKKVLAECDEDELAEHGWSEQRPFKFGRPAMDLVVAAIDAGDLEWDRDKGLGVFRRFSASPEWLVIPRREAAS